MLLFIVMLNFTTMIVIQIVNVYLAVDIVSVLAVAVIVTWFLVVVVVAVAVVVIVVVVVVQAIPRPHL